MSRTVKYLPDPGFTEKVIKLKSGTVRVKSEPVSRAFAAACAAVGAVGVAALLTTKLYKCIK